MSAQTATPLRSKPAAAVPQAGSAKRSGATDEASAAVPTRSACPCGGGCPSCASTPTGAAPVRTRAGLALRAKRDVGAEQYPAEQSADIAADQAMSAGTVSHAVAAAPPSNSPNAGLAPALVEKVLAEDGQALEPTLRTDMEHRFRRDFSAVRVHAGSASADSARAVSARAYTVGNDIVFGAGQYATASDGGRRLIAHELAHVTQHDRAGIIGKSASTTLHRTPAPPQASGSDVPFDRSKVDVSAVPDIDASPPPPNPAAASSSLPVIAQSVTVAFSDPAVVKLTWEFYDASDVLVPLGFSTKDSDADATTRPFLIQNAPATAWTPVAGRHLVRCIGLNATGDAIAYADRSFWVWTTKPTGKAPDIAALIVEKKKLEAITKKGSGKSIGEVGAATTRLKDLNHDLAILETGTGNFVGNKCTVVPTGATPTDCTDIVIKVLGEIFAQQGLATIWAKIQKKYAENTKARGGSGLSGIDVQAALQSEAGWKGVYWAPDPKYQIPNAELSGARSDEASFTSQKKAYYKDYYKDNLPIKGYPGVSIAHKVTDYAPEKPTDVAAPASTATKDTSQLDKLRKVPFGVLSAHGGFHMTLISYGKVIEVHWRAEATDPNLIEQTDLETWAVGPNSGYHYYASGMIVAPAADIDAAFTPPATPATPARP